MKDSRLAAVVVLCCLLFSACAGLDLDEKRAASARVAADAGWQRLNLDTRAFVLAAFVPPRPAQSEALTIYIEGDGFAWIDAATPSFDPTPLDPLALRLALHDATGTAVYLARPCQYVAGPDRRGCEAKYWTSHRFAPEVIEATSAAIDQLMARYGAQRLELVGYSGGGAVAALVAAERGDIARLITVAAPLDHRAWTSADGLAPLSGSLNPADAWQRLRRVPQRHYFGGKDRTVSEAVARSYAERYPPGERPEIVVIQEFDHRCCWLERWRSLR